MTKTYLEETKVNKYRIGRRYLWDVKLVNGVLSYELGSKSEADNFEINIEDELEEQKPVVEALEAAGIEKVEWMDWNYC